MPHWHRARRGESPGRNPPISCPKPSNAFGAFCGATLRPNRRAKAKHLRGTV